VMRQFQTKAKLIRGSILKDYLKKSNLIKKLFFCWNLQLCDKLGCLSLDKILRRMKNPT
jgi:hypothetical protein